MKRLNIKGEEEADWSPLLLLLPLCLGLGFYVSYYPWDLRSAILSTMCVIPSTMCDIVYNVWYRLQCVILCTVCDIVYSVWYVILSTLNPNRKSQACTVNRLISRQWSHEAQRFGKLLQLHRLYLVVSFLLLRINISIKHKTTIYTKDWTTDQQKRQFLFWFLSLVFQHWNYERKL